MAGVAGMTLSSCMENCGTGSETFAWGTFAQQFSAWLLPSLALISQLPFGSKHRVDNIISVFLAVGSPMLAAYSLALTVLNGRWVARRFSGMTYPNSMYAFRILSSLQQTPFNIRDDGRLSSLVILHQNDAWWKDLAERIEFTHTWTIAAAAQLSWVLIAYIFTVADSFNNLPPQPSADGLSDGQAVGSLWLWLLAVVFGWLQISPKCDDARIRNAISRSNEIAYVATSDGEPIKASAQSTARAFYMRTERQEDDSLYDEQERTPPIYNYARLLSWSLNVEIVRAVYAAASHCAESNRPVDYTKKWKSSDPNTLHAENRVGSLKQVQRYGIVRRPGRWGRDIAARIFLATVFAALLQWGTSMAAVVIVYTTPTKGLGCRSLAFLLYASAGTMVWALLITSSFLTHLVATSYEYGSFPKPGDNIEEGAFQMAEPNTREGRVSDISGGRTLAEQETGDDDDETDELLHSNRHHYSPSLEVARILAILLRRTAKILATLNAFGIVTINIMTFAKYLNSCRCLTANFSPNENAHKYLTILVDSSVGSSWGGAVALGLGSAFLYIFFVNVFINPSP